jgi:hypothetical protein
MSTNKDNVKKKDHIFTEEELDKILEQKRNADYCETQFPDCPTKPNDASCLNCPLYKKYK